MPGGAGVGVGGRGRVEQAPRDRRGLADLDADGQRPGWLDGEVAHGRRHHPRAVHAVEARLHGDDGQQGRAPGGRRRALGGLRRAAAARGRGVGAQRQGVGQRDGGQQGQDEQRAHAGTSARRRGWKATR
ncbi:MAG: hypothetical protein H6706_12505 [Myxococcales bacterium]|nr:hypothetical protein [Myxococcales bacterium]